MNTKFRSSRRSLLAALVLSALSASAMAADDNAPWVSDVHSSARLLAGGSVGDTPVLRAGVEIKMEPNWKTYWRYPGDSGVPPRFDFSGSQNVQSVKVLWPAPHRFSDESGTSIGYKEGVIFPLHVTPKQAGKPVRLHLKLDYATCEKLCVPAEARGEITLTGTGVGDALITAAEARVPKVSQLGDPGPLAIRAVRRVAGASRPRVLVEVAAPEGADVELLAEGPTPEWALPVPVPAQGAPAGVRQFSFELDGLPAGADPMSKGLALTLTAVAGPQSIEVPIHLD